MKLSKLALGVTASVALAAAAHSQTAEESAVFGGNVQQECSFSDIDPIDLDLNIVTSATADGLELVEEEASTTTPYVGCNFVVSLTMTSTNGALVTPDAPAFDPSVFTDEIDYLMLVEFQDVAGTEITGFSSEFLSAGTERVRGPYGPFFSDLTVTVETTADLRPVAGDYAETNVLEFVPEI